MTTKKDAREIELAELLETERQLAMNLSREFAGRPFRVYLVRGKLADMVWTRYDMIPRTEIEGYPMELKYSYMNGEPV